MDAETFYKQLYAHVNNAAELMIKNKAFGDLLVVLTKMSSSLVGEIREIDNTFAPEVTKSDELSYLKELHQHLHNSIGLMFKSAVDHSLLFEKGDTGLTLELLTEASLDIVREIRKIEKKETKLAKLKPLKASTVG